MGKLYIYLTLHVLIYLIWFDLLICCDLLIHHGNIEQNGFFFRSGKLVFREPSVTEDYEAGGGEVLVDDEDNDGWVATHRLPKGLLLYQICKIIFSSMISYMINGSIDKGMIGVCVFVSLGRFCSYLITYKTL